jgi:hypothetical protein
MVVSLPERDICAGTHNELAHHDSPLPGSVLRTDSRAKKNR